MLVQPYFKNRWWRPTWKKTVWASALSFVAMLAIAAGFSGCMSFQMSDADIAEHFQSRGQDLPEFFEHSDEEGSIFLARKGTGPTVVFIHGSPGSWDNFIYMLSDVSLNSGYTVAAVDRPGFGRTLPKKAEPLLAVQAKRIHDAVEASGVSLPAVWIGHSLGGPVVAKLAIDYPDAVAGLVLIAPSMDPDLEKRKWYNWVAKFPLVKWSLSKSWRNSNEEIFPHKKELEKFAGDLPNLAVPTVVLQGDADELVPVGNAYYVAEVLPAGVVELRILEGVNHFIPWTNPEEMKDAVQRVWELAAETSDAVE